jgi:hypothetical protein
MAAAAPAMVPALMQLAIFNRSLAFQELARLRRGERPHQIDGDQDNSHGRRQFDPADDRPTLAQVARRRQHRKRKRLAGPPSRG